MTSTYGCFHNRELAASYEGLSPEQAYAFAKFATGKNIFVTGPGGTGKTRFIQFLVQYMSSKMITHQVCALTGCAAVLLNCKAKTIHSWSGIRLCKGDPNEIVRRVLSSRASVAAWKQVKVLVIDEISMMSSKIFGILDKIGRSIFRLNKPFGGLQLVFTGDFFQLPPIGDSGDPSSGEFCFQHKDWATTFPPENCIELTTFFRQTDPKYINILQEIRHGNISAESVNILAERVHGQEPIVREDGIVPTKLFPLRTKVDYINTTTYSKLKNEEHSYNPIIQTNSRVYVESGKPIPYELCMRGEQLTPDQVQIEAEKITDSLQTEKTVRLKLGTLVMCTANLDIESGICNGSQGIVVDFAESAAPNGTTVLAPIVRFVNGSIRKVNMFSRQCEEYPTIVVSQIPLRLAWAMTIHKIQGATLDIADMDIGKSVFEYGQSYVALSRVKTLDGLYLSDFDPAKISANPIVVEFYASFAKPEDPTAQTDRWMTSAFGKRTIPEPKKDTDPIPEYDDVMEKISGTSAAAPVGETKRIQLPATRNPFGAFSYKR